MKKITWICLLFPLFISAQELDIIPQPVSAKLMNEISLSIPLQLLLLPMPVISRQRIFLALT